MKVLKYSSWVLVLQSRFITWPVKRILVLIFLWPGLMWSQEQTTPSAYQVSLDEIVISARRHPDTVLSTPSSIQVIKKINELLPRTTPELFLGNTGIWIQKTNHGSGSPFIRGLTGQHALLLMDGIRINNAIFRSGPNQYLNTVDPWMLDRVEILSGLGGVTYGSDALGGTIALSSKDLAFNTGREWQGQVWGQWASRGMEKSVRMESTYLGPRLAITGGLTGRDFGDLVAGKGLGKLVPTGYRQLSWDGKAMLRVSEHQRLILAHQNMHQEDVPIFHKIQLENFRVNQFDPQVRQLNYLRWLGEFPGSSWPKSWAVTMSQHYFGEGRQSQKNGNSSLVEEKDIDNTWGLQGQMTLQPKTWWNISTGIDVFQDNISSTRQIRNSLDNSILPQRGLYADDSRMQQLAWYALHAFHWRQATIHTGWRYNYFRLTIPEETLGTVELTPSAWVYNLGFNQAFSKNLYAFVSVNTAFRAPNIDDLSTLGIVDFRFEKPNYALKPEWSVNKEIGIKWRSRIVSAQGVFFHHRLKNLIGRIKTDEIQQGYPVFFKTNITQGYIYGLEEDMDIRISSHWSLRQFIRYTYGQNVTQDEPWRRISPLFSSWRLDWRPNSSWNAFANILWAGRQNRLAQGDKDDNRINPTGTPGWQVVNIGMSYRFSVSQIFLHWNNIFNEAYRMHGSGVDGVGSHVVVTAQWRW